MFFDRAIQYTNFTDNQPVHNAYLHPAQSVLDSGPQLLSQTRLHMALFHYSVLNEKWFELSLVQQMINIGNEVKRALKFSADLIQVHNSFHKPVCIWLYFIQFFYCIWFIQNNHFSNPPVTCLKNIISHGAQR